MASSNTSRVTKKYSLPLSVGRGSRVVHDRLNQSRESSSSSRRATVPFPTPPGPINTTTNVSADKSLKKLLSLARSQTSSTAGLGNRGALHAARRLHLADGGQGTNEVVGAHLRDTFLVLRQSEQLLEREIARLHEFLDFGATTTIRHRCTRRSYSLLVGE